MARQVLPWVGAAAGAFVGMYAGNPALGAQIGFALGSAVGNAVDPQVLRGPSLGEGQNNSASEGGYRPIVLGKGAVGVCMIHQGPMITRVIRHRQSKGGGPITEEERRYRTMAFALGESADPDVGVRLMRLWVDNKLVYDVTPTTQIAAESAEFADRFTFYPGDNLQLPDPDLEAMPAEWGGGAGNVPSYRGGAPYIVFPEWDVTDSRGMAPMIKAELVSRPTVESSAALAIGYSNPLSPGMTASDDGLAWSTPPVAGGANAINIIALDQSRFFIVDGVASFWTDDFGATKHMVALDGYGGPHHGQYRNGVMLVGGSLDGLWRSTDRGETVSVVPGAGNSSGAAITNTFAVSIYDQSAPKYSTDKENDWTSWQTGNHTGLYVGASLRDIAGCQTYAAACGNSNDDLTPAVSFTENASIWTLRKIEASTADHVRCIAVSDDGSLLLAATNDNEIFWTVDKGETWEKCETEMNVNDVCFNGSHFILVGTEIDGNTPAIKITADGVTLSDATSFPWDDEPSANYTLVGSLGGVLPSITGDKLPLMHIIDFCHDRVDARLGNTSELTDEVEGVVFADGYMAADVIRTAMGWYTFDAAEADFGSGYRINYVKRGGAAEATLTEDDIVEGPEDWEREDSYERPRVLHIAYPNPVVDYGAPNIPIKRTSPDVLVVGERSIAVPFVTSDQDEIARRGDVLMTIIYTEIAGDYELVLPVNWLTLAPTNCIGFSIRGRIRRLRMTEFRYADGTIKARWRADRQSAVTSNLTALPPVRTLPPPPSIVGPTISAALDIPALADSMDTLHLLVAASGQSPAWWGAAHQLRLQAETDFTTAATFRPPTTIMGLLETDVAAASPHFTDTTNVVRVTLYTDDELETFTQQQFLSEHGAFALAWNDGGTRRWEVMQYRDAVKVGDRTWELTTLARGRLNTDAPAHPIGSLFVLLDAGIRAIPAPSAWLGQDITHRAVSNGQLPDAAVPYTEPYTGQSQREFPVAHLFVERDGDDYILTAVPRHRFGTDDNPIRSVNWDGFVFGYAYGGQSNEVMTTSPTHTFTLPGASDIDFHVLQLNRITGRGPAVTVNIP